MNIYGIKTLEDQAFDTKKALNELQDMIESVDAYDGQEALDMLDRVYGFVRSYTGRKSMAERRPELVGMVGGGGNLKEGLE
jgi:hypothetical protein